MSQQVFLVVWTIVLVAIGLYATLTQDRSGSATAFGLLFLISIPWVGKLDRYIIGGGNLKLETSPRMGQWIHLLVGLGCLVWAALMWQWG